MKIHPVVFDSYSCCKIDPDPNHRQKLIIFSLLHTEGIQISFKSVNNFLRYGANRHILLLFIFSEWHN